MFLCTRTKENEIKSTRSRNRSWVLFSLAFPWERLRLKPCILKPARTGFNSQPRPSLALITYSSLITSVYNKLSNSIYHLQLLLRSRNDTRKHWTTVHGTLDVILKTLFMSQRCAWASLSFLMSHVHAVSLPIDAAQILQNKSYRCLWATWYVFWETNLGPVEEQQGLSTPEPSPQLLK